MKGFFFFLGAFAALVGFWHGAVELFGLPDYILPNPVSVLQAGLEDRRALWEGVTNTFLVATTGIIIASVVSLIMLILAYISKATESVFAPVLITLQSIPVVALAPLLNIWFAGEWWPRVTIAALFPLFPLAISLIRSIRSADDETILFGRAIGLSRAGILRWILLPSSLSGFFTGMRVAFPLAVVGAIVAEYAGAQSGIGHYMVLAQRRLNPELLFAGVICAAALGLTVFVMVALVERHALPWRRTGIGE